MAVRTNSYSRIFTILAAMVAVLILVGGVAFAVTRNCQSNHKCVGTDKSDTLFGTSNPDRIYGLKGGDVLAGLGESDRLFGDGGSDQLWGGDPANVANDDGADDKLSGGGGSDEYMFGDGWGHDTIIDKAVSDEDPLTGNRVVFSSSSGSPGRLTINLDSDSGPLPEVTDELGSNTIDWDGDVIDRVLNGHTTHDIITGNDRANEIISKNGNDDVSGGGGDDYIDVQDGLGGDTVDCGEGNDTVFFDSGDTVLNCEVQNS